MISESLNQGLKPQGKKNIAILALVSLLVLAVIGVSVYLFMTASKNQADSDQPAASQQPQETTVRRGENPLTGEKVESQERLDPIEEYFKKVSPDNFKVEFMTNVGNDTLSAYEQYSTATDEEMKFEAARILHISLNNNLVNRGDENYVGFLNDVQLDLETSLGKLLY